ncbi:hypothetical protein MTO96_024003 [Rhipicephalus appendiculatus]
MAKDVGAYLKKQQEQGPPELSQQWAEFEELYNKRLWHQLTLKLLTFVRSPEIQPGLFQMYENFISEFENKMKPLSLVEIAAQVSQSIPDMEQRLAFITKTKEKVKADPEAVVLCNVLYGQNKLAANDMASVKKVLEETESQAEALPGVTEVHGRFYQLCSDYHQQMGDHQAYYRDALRFLGCTPLERIPLEEQRQRAFALCLAALLGEGVYNFGELLAHPILECLQGTDRHWVVQLLSAFNSGSLAQYEELRPSWSRQSRVRPCLDKPNILSRRLPRHVDTISVQIQRQAGPPGPFKNPKRRSATLTLTSRASTSAVPTLSYPGDVDNPLPTALGQPAAFLSCTHTPATSTAGSVHATPSLKATFQPACIVTMPTTDNALSEAKRLEPVPAVTQSAAFVVNNAWAAAPESKSRNTVSALQSAALAAVPIGSAPGIARVNAESAEKSILKSRVPLVPTVLPTSIMADETPAEIDFTVSQGSDDDSSHPEGSWTTVSANQKPASTARPHTELIIVGIQLPLWTLTPKLPLYDLLAYIIAAANLSPKTSAEVTLPAKPAQSLVFLKTDSPLTAHLLLSLTNLELNAFRPSAAAVQHLYPPILLLTFAPNPGASIAK